MSDLRPPVPPFTLATPTQKVRAAGDRIAVRFACEWHGDSGHWRRSLGHENWEFNAQGFRQRRFASVNDLPIAESARLFHGPLGRRADDPILDWMRWDCEGLRSARCCPSFLRACLGCG